MFSKAFQRKYALTDQGLKNTKSGAFWTVVTNLVVMGGMGILYLLMGGFMGTLTDGAPLPGAALPAVLTVGFVLLSFVTHLQQYRATYGLVYGEVKTTRLRLAERLRKLPLGYFGADLTETIMGDVNRMEHVWSHVLGYLYGAYISTAIIALCLLFYDWRLMIACLWGVPVAFGLLFGSRKIAAQNSEVTKKAALRVSDGIQEALENVREIRAANQEERYLAGQCRQRDHAPGRSDYHPDGSQPDFVRTDRLHGAVPVPAGHHPGVRPLRPEPGSYRGNVHLPSICRPHQRDLRNPYRQRGGDLPASGPRHYL